MAPDKRDVLYGTVVSRLRALVARCRDWVRARRLDEDFQQQIAAHLEEATEAYVAQGMAPADARRAALREFGDVGRARESWREARSLVSFDHLRRDLQHAVRGLRRSPAFTISVVSVLALGLGAVTAIFTLLTAVVLRPLPFAEADRLVSIRISAPGRGLPAAAVPAGVYFHYLDRSRTMESIALYTEPSLLNLHRSGDVSERIRVTYASAAVFRVLRATPALGRLFTDDDGRPGFMNMRWQIPVLLSHRFWVSQFGSDPAIAGRVLTINDSPREVVGVMPETFVFPTAETDLWVLIEPSRRTTRIGWGSGGWETIARVRADQSIDGARAELAALLQELAGGDPAVAEARPAPILTPLKDVVIGDIGQVLWLVFGGMVLLWLVACANAGGLFLVRAEQRGREVAVRRALGAHGPHLARLFFAEALVVTLAAATLGLLVTRVMVAMVLRLAPAELPRATEIQVDGASVAFAAGMAIVMAGFYCGLLLRNRREPLTSAMRRQAVVTRRGRPLAADAFIVAQVALALLLLAGSALMVQTSRNLARRDLGFVPDDVVTFELGMPSRKAGRHAQIYHDVVARLRQVPQVTDASAVSSVPLTPNEFLYPFEPGAPPIAFKFFVPGYFQAMRISIPDGERFEAGARPAAASPVLVSAALARRLSSGASAIGQPIRRLNADGSIVDVNGPVPAFTIAGIAADVREASLRDGPTDVVYIPIVDPPVERSIVPTTMQVVVRAPGRLTSLVPSLRAAIADVDPDLSVRDVRAMADVVAAARARETFVGTLLLTAAMISLMLGAVGIYGSVSQLVRRRTREIGVRIALGAGRDEVTRMVTAGCVRAVALGAGIGVMMSVLSGRLLESLLFGVAAYSPRVLGLVTVMLIGVATAAALLAARQATRIAPLDALRAD